MDSPSDSQAYAAAALSSDKSVHPTRDQMQIQESLSIKDTSQDVLTITIRDSTIQRRIIKRNYILVNDFEKTQYGGSEILESLKSLKPGYKMIDETKRFKLKFTEENNKMFVRNGHETIYYKTGGSYSDVFEVETNDMISKKYILKLLKYNKKFNEAKYKNDYQIKSITNNIPDIHFYGTLFFRSLKPKISTKIDPDLLEFTKNFPEINPMDNMYDKCEYIIQPLYKNQNDIIKENLLNKIKIFKNLTKLLTNIYEEEDLLYDDLKIENLGYDSKFVVKLIDYDEVTIQDRYHLSMQYEYINIKSTYVPCYLKKDHVRGSFYNKIDNENFDKFYVGGLAQVMIYLFFNVLFILKIFRIIDLDIEYILSYLTNDNFDKMFKSQEINHKFVLFVKILEHLNIITIAYIYKILCEILSYQPDETIFGLLAVDRDNVEYVSDIKQRLDSLLVYLEKNKQEFETDLIKLEEIKSSIDIDTKLERIYQKIMRRIQHNPLFSKSIVSELYNHAESDSDGGQRVLSQDYLNFHYCY